MSNELEELVYEFDLKGFVVLRNAITADEINVVRQWWRDVGEEQPLFDLSFVSDSPWAFLLDHDAYWGLLCALFDGNPRLDHAFGVTEDFVSSRGELHHHADMASQCIFHTSHRGKLFVGMVGVSIAFADIGAGRGGFCCIPGSHKSLVGTPPRFMRQEDNPLLVQVPQVAGDVIVFSEALTHGTSNADQRDTRRSVFLRYLPGFAAFREPAVAPLTRLPFTPNYQHGLNEGLVDATILSDRQAKVVTRPPFARGRGRP